MRVIVISDTHKHFNLLKELWKNTEKRRTPFCIWGDGGSDVEELKLLDPEVNIVAVKGNCDIGRDFPDEERITIGEGRILMIHGHRYNVKNPEGRKERLSSLPRKETVTFYYMATATSATLVISTGVYIMNPGSPLLPKTVSLLTGLLISPKRGSFLFWFPVRKRFVTIPRLRRGIVVIRCSAEK